MNKMDLCKKFNRILPNEKAGLILYHNPHKSEYQTVERYCEINLEDDNFTGREKEKCIERDELWVLEWYPDTPIGRCCIASSSMEGLFDE